jgi:hypothetical protein
LTKLVRFVVAGIKVLCRLMHVLGSYGANFSPFRRRFSPEVIHVGFMGDRVALGEGFSPSTWFSTATISPYSSSGTCIFDKFEVTVPRDPASAPFQKLNGGGVCKDVDYRK